MADTDRSINLARGVLALSIAVFTAASLGMACRVEPFFTWFFLFAWWSYVFGLESFLHLRSGWSTLYQEPRRFLLWLPLSIAFWLVFELFNLRLDNWGYINLPSTLWIRWLGYGASFATVLPGLFATERLLSFLGVWEDASGTVRPWLVKRSGLLMAVGATMLLLSLAWPTYFFPLVWGGVLLLLDPVTHRLDGKSLLFEVAAGRPGRVLRLLAAGMICGLLWESWNFFAGAKWYYTVPFVGQLKLFEMPVLGFFGFPPFALECFAMTALAETLLQKSERWPKRGKMALAMLLSVSLLAFFVLVFYCIDQRTVDSFV